MKRFFVLLLAVVMCFSLCACIGDSEDGEKSAVASALKEGKWRRSFELWGMYVTDIYEFKNNGRFEHTRTQISDQTSSKIETGDFVIEEAKIVCTDDDYGPDDEPWEIYYTYEDGHLELTIKGTNQEWELEHLED